jgi:hypothetical protein
MAYAATITIRRRTFDGRRAFVVGIAETEARDTSETEITDATGERLPRVGTVVQVKSTLTPGTGTTIDPTLGNATGAPAASQRLVWANGTAAAHIFAGPSALGTYTGGRLFWRSTPNSTATDHTVNTEIIIVEGVYGA